MIITPYNGLGSSLDDLVSADQYTTRTLDQPHLSDGLKVLRSTIVKVRTSSEKNLWTDEELSMAGELGLLFEDVLSKALTDRLIEKGEVIRPGELHCDGVINTPDLLIANSDPIRVGEVKVTWKSCRAPIDDQRFWFYWVQLKSYCHVLKIRHGRLHVLFVCGDYRRPIKPQFHVYDAEFTALECYEAFEMVKRHIPETIR